MPHFPLFVMPGEGHREEPIAFFGNKIRFCYHFINMPFTCPYNKYHWQEIHPRIGLGILSRFKIQSKDMLRMLVIFIHRT